MFDMLVLSGERLIILYFITFFLYRLAKGATFTSAFKLELVTAFLISSVFSIGATVLYFNAEVLV